MNALKVGVFLPTQAGPGESPGDATAAARQAEALGLESVWVVDQLIVGEGAPLVESVVALAAAAGATSRVKLGFGVVVVPLRSPVWLAKQVASLQHVSGNRVLLGVGAGGDRHRQSWAAAGVDRRQRGRRLDAALRALPSLIGGETTRVHGLGAPVRLAPGAKVPPILVGGGVEVALRRAAEYGDGWMPVADPQHVAAARPHLDELAAVAGRPSPSITIVLLAAISGDPRCPTRRSCGIF